MNRLKVFASYFWEIPLRRYQSEYSGELIIALANGRKILNTSKVNYSYNSLHRVFKNAFRKTDLQANSIQNTLVLGLGGGSIIKILRESYGLITPITVVEIDPIVIQIAKEEFAIEQYAPIDIKKMDAYEFMRTNTQSFDLICIDIFIEEKVPEQFLSAIFLQLLLAFLHPGGSIYFNIMIPNEEYQSKFDGVYRLMEEKKGTEIQALTCLQMEENNRVLIVKK